MRLDLSRFSKRRIAAVAAGGVVVAGLAVLPVLPAFAAVSCSVTATNNVWTESPGTGGYTSNLTLRNTGDPLTTWTLRVTLPSGQSLTQGWSATWSLSGSTLSAVAMSWNANLATGASTSIGYNGRWSGSFVAPSAFSVNGVNCGGTPPPPPPTTGPQPTTPGPTPTSPRPTTPPPTTPPPTTPPPTPTPCTGAGCPVHVDNPYVGARGYVNPDWAANVNTVSGGNRISNQSTAVWMDRIAAIAGTTSARGLRSHLDAAVTQMGTGTPVTIQIVIYDLPNRDCSALASNGELLIAQNGLARYRAEYIDPIAAMFAEPAYRNLRIVTIIEIDSLPNLVTNLSVAKCAEAQSSGAYVQGIQYALNKLHAIQNVYTYIDAAHHGWIGWSSNFGPTADLLASTAEGTTSRKASVDGFIVNTANYSALTEPFFNINTTVGGQSIRNSRWVDFNDYVDELSFAQAFRNRLVSAGFPSNIGMLIDTSRNGWGGTARPTAASTSTDVNTFVNASKIDRRIHAGNWCNQSGAGLGERPRAAPASGIDAYVWVKPPGESDGSSTEIPNNEGKGFDRMCDPTYGGNERNGMSATGALPNSPLSGAWFSAQFQQLMANAFPAL
jgi:cellulose 1,4-beta-cellobiosidase